MAQYLDDIENRVIALLGTHLCNDKHDYGVIVDYIVTTMDGGRHYAFVTDSGRTIDAVSAMRFLNAYRRKLANAPAIAFPDGSDTVMRRRVMKVRRSGSSSLGGSVSTTAKVGDETINISSTVTSAGSFPEEYRDNYPNGKGK